MVRLSFLVPTHNRRDLLEETLRSILAQGDLLKDVEIVISNDASSDNTKDFLTSFQHQNASLNIRIFHHEKNLGGPGNWEFLLKEAHGEFVFLLSDDDTIKSDFLKAYFLVMEKYPKIDLIYSAIDYCDEQMNLRSTHQLSSVPGLVSGLERVKNQLLANHMVMSVVYRRSTLLKAGGWQKRFGTCLDSGAFALACAHSEQTYFLTNSFLRFRVGTQSWSSFKVEKQKNLYIWFRSIIDEVNNWVKKEHPDQEGFFRLCYAAHAQGILNMLDLKMVHGTLSKRELQHLLKDLRQVFPEAMGLTSFYKLSLVSYLGIAWLQALRGILKKNNIYGTSVFEKDFKESA